MNDRPAPPGEEPELFASVSDQIGQFLTASWEMWAAVAAGWQAMLTNRGAPAVRAVAERLLKPAAWPDGLPGLLSELQQIFALPQFSDLSLLDAGSLPSLVPASELAAVASEFMLAALSLSAHACERFQNEMAARRAGDRWALASAGDALDVWNNVLDQTLMEFNRSAGFADLQRRLLRAAMGQRQEIRKFGERLAQTVDLPTRTEMTDVYQRLHDLRREVHSLRRELRAIRDAGPTEPKRRAPRRKGNSA